MDGRAVNPDDDESTRQSAVPGRTVEQIAIAAAAAEAARSAPGVIRLQPGLKGLLKQFAAEAWERATGRELPDVAGVEVGAGAALEIGVRIVAGADHRAADVGLAVHDAVVAAVEGATGRVPTVRVRIVDIDLEPHYS
ncbi:hypothetical protein [Kribbella sp. NPDC055071]